MFAVRQARCLQTTLHIEEISPASPINRHTTSLLVVSVDLSYCWRCCIINALSGAGRLWTLMLLAELTNAWRNLSLHLTHVDDAKLLNIVSASTATIAECSYYTYLGATFLNSSRHLHCTPCWWHIFSRMLHCNHVLQPFLQERSISAYSLRSRTHNDILIDKTGDLNERDFIIRLLYKDSYWS